MNSKEAFENMGYEQTIRKTNTGMLEIDYDNGDLHKYITFYQEQEAVLVNQYQGVDLETVELTPAEISAIYRQSEELGWYI